MKTKALCVLAMLASETGLVPPDWEITEPNTPEEIDISRICFFCPVVDRRDSHSIDFPVLVGRAYRDSAVGNLGLGKWLLDDRGQSGVLPEHATDMVIILPHTILRDPSGAKYVPALVSDGSVWSLQFIETNREFGENTRLMKLS